MSRDSSAPKPNKNNVSIHDRGSAISDVIFSSIGEGAVIIDERGNIARVNQIALDILGYKASELIGKWYPGTIVAEDEDGKIIPHIERPVMEVFFSGKPVFKRLYLKKKDGSKIPVALTVSPVMQDDKPIGAIELFRDITKEIQLEHAKDEFISIASHQLRTPATVVKQYLGMIIDGYVNSKDQQLEMLRIAYEHNENELDIINDLLNIAQAEANKVSIVRKKTDLVKLVSKVIKSQKPDYDIRNMKLLLESKKSSIICMIDPLHIQMVFENLINNANKYSPPGSIVKVKITSTSTDVTIQVKDEGIGIAAEDISKLFKKFSRLESVHSIVSGTGLGLYWAKKLIELHKGDITVSSKLGKGTTFTVILPIEEQP